MDSKRKKPARPKSDLTSRQLWILAMKEGKTGTTSQPTEGFTNLKVSGQKDLGYLSTSHYLRQVAGTEKATPRPDSANAAGRASSTGRPNYKSAEEYYDEVIALKRELKAVREEMSSMKSKSRRLEEDYQKREKQLETLFDPTKNAELRRALSDKNGETALVVQSLKQRIFKLEQQLRDKEATVAKLQSDVKVTKTAEMKTQLEVLYKEIVRLRSSNPADVLYSNEPAIQEQEQAPKKAAQKLDALTGALRKVTDQKNVLAAENAQLKKRELALQEKLDELEGSTAIPESYRDMNRNEMLSRIRMLEQENDRLKVAPSGNQDVAKSKISPTGNVREKLELLDRRETELLSELAAKTDANKRLIEERDSYKLQLQDAKRDIERLNFENAGLAKEVDRLRADAANVGHIGGGVGAFRSASPASSAASAAAVRGDRGDRDRDEFAADSVSSRKPAPRQEKPAPGKKQGAGSRMKENEAVTKLQSVLRGHKARQDFLRRDQDRDQRPSPDRHTTLLSDDGDSSNGEDDLASLRRRPRSRSNSSRGGAAIDDAASGRRSSSSIVQASTSKHSNARSGRRQTNMSHRRSFDDDDDVLVD